MKKSKTSNNNHFYITEGGEVVIGYEVSSDVFHNKVIGNVADIKGRYIRFDDDLSYADEDVPTKKRSSFIDFIFKILKFI